MRVGHPDIYQRAASVNEQEAVEVFMHKRVTVDVIGQRRTGEVRSVAMLHGDGRVSLVIYDREKEELVGVAAQPHQVELHPEEVNE